MNKTLVKSEPPGEFVEISVLMVDWQTQLQMMASQSRPIKLDIYPHPNLFQVLQDGLDQHGYSALIPENDRWEHFLVPNRNPKPARAI